MGAQAYRDQYGLDAIFLLPANLYGPRDNFDLESSHVIPALVRKLLAGEDEVVLWGDGSPTREFLYVDDCAEGLLLAADRYDGREPVNLGTGVETSIRELAETIAELTGFSGRDRLGHRDAERPAAAAASTRAERASCSASRRRRRCATGWSGRSSGIGRTRRATRAERGGAAAAARAARAPGARRPLDRVGPARREARRDVVRLVDDRRARTRAGRLDERGRDRAACRRNEVRGRRGCRVRPAAVRRPAVLLRAVPRHVRPPRDARLRRARAHRLVRARGRGLHRDRRPAGASRGRAGSRRGSRRGDRVDRRVVDGSLRAVPRDDVEPDPALVPAPGGDDRPRASGGRGSRRPSPAGWRCSSSVASTAPTRAAASGSRSPAAAPQIAVLLSSVALLVPPLRLRRSPALRRDPAS